MNFNYNLPVNLLFGRGRLNELGSQTAAYGKRALLVSGGSSAKRSGLLDRAVGLLQASGVTVTQFEGVPQNPLATTVIEGAELFKRSDCDVVVGIGGGSVLDTAKAIAFAAVNEGDIFDYIFGLKPAKGAYPIILAPTTAGTGSEGNCFAVLTNPENYDKKSLKSPYTYAKVSIIDPELLMTMPKSVIASTTFDAFAHSHEAFLSKTSQPLSELMALHAIKLLGENIRRVYNDPGDIEAWERVSFASTLGGMVINLAGVGLPHAMEHPASGLRNIVHGSGLAAVTPAVMEFNYEVARDKYERLAKALGGSGAGQAIELVQKLIVDIGLNIKLSELGVKAQDIGWMSGNAMKIMKANIDNNPKPVGVKDLAALYEKCM